ncbi:MAG: acyl-CoA dehydrogenase family protein [Acidimicrobiales bacterium]
MAEFSMAMTEEQEQLRDWINGFAVDVMRPNAAEWDEREETPWPIIEEAAKIGLYGWEFLAEMMMNDPSGQSLMIAIEEMFWGDAGLAMSIMGSALAAAGIAAVGTSEQVLEWVPQCYGTAEDIKLGAFCSSEPDAGSDVSAIRTKATYDEAKDEWTLNGTKTWITNGGIADIHVVVAVVDAALGTKGHASFIVPAEAKLDGSLRQGQKFKKHGIRASHTAEVILEDVKIPGSFLLGGKDRMDEKFARLHEGGPGSGSGSAAMKTFEATRPGVGAQAVGIARAAFEYSRDYAKERVQFGRPIIQNQSIAFMLADMATEIEASRLLVRRAAWLAKNGEFTSAEGSMAKLKAGRTATWVTERAIQILGGYGYTREYPVERWHRDAKIHDIFEGTEQIQQLVISRAISGMRIE